MQWLRSHSGYTIQVCHCNSLRMLLHRQCLRDALVCYDQPGAGSLALPSTLLSELHVLCTIKMLIWLSITVQLSASHRYWANKMPALCALLPVITGGDVMQLRAEMPTVVGDVEVPRGADVFLLTGAPARYPHCIVQIDL
jgi:hypothetical protein